MSRLRLLAMVLLAPLSAHAAVPEFSSFVALGSDGVAVARVLTEGTSCPSIRIDGHDQPMKTRVGPGISPLRTTISKPEDSKPSAFPVRACEAVLPRGAKRVSVLGRRLPVPAPRVDRIVVIGDTGCRLKGKEVQACNDPTVYPFARVAQEAAAWHPDLVLHVGDYLYRETPCPTGQPGCAGSPWGYGWDAWSADFFSPGEDLLRAAPWVFVRGNHENCNRGGQGWWRFIDTQPFVPGRDCSDPARDAANDDAPPYAVPLGSGAQIVVMDIAFADENKPLDPAAPAAAPIRAAYARLDALSRPGTFTFAATHKPILGFAATAKGGQAQLRPGNMAIQSVFGTLNPDLLPAKVDVLLAGHYHVWEQVSFASNHPSQFIAGFSGTQEDIVPMPETLPADATPAPGAKPDRFSSWVDGFGYMTMERRDARHWAVKVWDLSGKVVNTCRIDGRHSECDKAMVR